MSVVRDLLTPGRFMALPAPAALPEVAKQAEIQAAAESRYGRVC
jgi:hypothetical protein